MNLQMFQSGGAVLHLITDRELFLRLELRQHIVLIRHSPEPFLISGNHVLRDIVFYSCLIAVGKMGGPIHHQLFAVSVDLTLVRVKVHLIDTNIVHTESMENIVAPFLKLTYQIAPFQGRHDKIRRGLEHIGCILQRLYGRIVYAVKADDLLTVIKRNHYERVDALLFQILVLKRIGLADIFHIPDDDVSADAEIPIPACAYLRRNVLEVILFRGDTVGYPFVGIIVAAGFVPLKYVGSFSVQRLAQML